MVTHWTIPVWALLVLAAPVGSLAQQPDGTQVIEEIVTVGTRTAGRTVTDSPVPVDVFSQDELESVGASADLTDVISKLVPSFNVGREPISDGATFVRPPNLRGLDSDKTLVLVNGKRRHRAALVRLGGFGSHGPDLAAIPVIALRSVEVLRDGAGAQYGSDAIAGVMNFNLKQSSEGADLQLHAGVYPDGGDDHRAAGHIGFRIGDEGFINFSGEYASGSGTSRGGRYDLALPGGSGTDAPTRHRWWKPIRTGTGPRTGSGPMCSPSFGTKTAGCSAWSPAPTALPTTPRRGIENI